MPTDNSSSSTKRPDEGQVTDLISRRPTWADQTEVDAEAIIHRWEARTEAFGDPDLEDEPSYPIRVEILQFDDLRVHDVGVAIAPGRPVIFLLDTNLDTANGRKLAAAILECCDRLDASAGAR